MMQTANRSHPLSVDRLIDLVVPSTDIELLLDTSGYARHGINSGGVFAANPYGPAWRSDGTADRVNFGTSTFLPTDQITVFYGMRKTDGTNRQSGAFGINGNATLAATETPARCGAHIPWSDGTVYWDFGGSTAGATRLSVASLGSTVGLGNDLWCFTTGPRGMEIWLNGIKRASNTATPTRSGLAVDFMLGTHGGHSLNVINADLAEVWLFRVYRRQLTAKLIAETFRDPWGMYRGRDEVALASSSADVVEPIGLASEESFGTPSLTFGLAAEGIASEVDSGSAILTHTLTADDLGSDEAFGEAELSDALQLTPDGIASEESFGIASLSHAFTDSGTPSDEALGTAILTHTLTANDLGSDEAFGEAELSDALQLAADGIASDESFGTAILTHTLTADGLGSDEVFGTHSTAADITLTVDGIPSDEAFGSASLTGAISAGYNIYVRSLVDGEDTLVAFVAAGIEELLVTGTENSEAWYHVKAVTRCQVEDTEPVRLKRVAFDAEGNLILPVPNAPIGLRATCGASGQITATWTYISNGQGAAPASFRVYVAIDEAEFDLTTADETVAASGTRIYSIDLGEFDHDAHVHIIVRAVAASGAIERNVNQITAIADALAPSPASALELEVVAS